MAAPDPTAELDRLVPVAPLSKVLGEHYGESSTVRLTGRALSGSSNVTVFAEFGGRALVVRRPPSGELLPTSHDVGREYRFLRALAGSVVPVATPILMVDDVDMIGVPFYVMERVDGFVLQDEIPSILDSPTELGRLCEVAIDTLADLHAVPWEHLDLPGRPSGYLARQVERWRDQLSRTPSAHRLTGVERLTEWVEEHLPDEHETTIVHGDFGLHNMIFQEAPLRVGAVLDWEMATLGDPLADLYWFLGGWTPGEGRSQNPANLVLDRPGARSVPEMLERYAARSGRDPGDGAFYRVFGGWKGIVILEGLYSAYLAGNAANPSVERFEHQVPAQLARLLGTLD